MPQIGAELFMVPWGHHKVIIDKFSSTPDKALFFVKKVIENDWSRGLLESFYPAIDYLAKINCVRHHTLKLLLRIVANQ